MKIDMNKWMFPILCWICGCLLAACSKDESGNKNLILAEGVATSQTVYADETSGVSEGIRFTASGNWTATVTDVTTKADATGVDWLVLSAYSGSAGKCTLTFTLTENLTGHDRQARIEIRCGDDVITITVEQKATTASGEIPSVSSVYLVARIDEVHKRVTAEMGTESEDRNIYYFEYDDQNRLVKQTTDDSGTGKGEDMIYTSFAYESGKIVITEKGYGSADVSTFVLRDDGYVETFSIVNDEGAGKTTEKSGLVVYEDGFVQTCNRTYRNQVGETMEYVDEAEWKNGNLVKVTNDLYNANNNRYVAEMRYDNAEYVNNPNINFDLNWVVCNTEWLDCFAFGGRYLQPYGYLGKRSQLYMTAEYDRYREGYYDTYTYEFDQLGRPVTIVRTSHGSDYYAKNETVFTITYK